MNLGTAQVIRGNALDLPLGDSTVDACITSPPYWSLRSYQDAGSHYAGQVGSEPTADEFIDNLLAATREMARVCKPTGSIFVNLGDKYSGRSGGPQGVTGGRADRAQAATYGERRAEVQPGAPTKSLMLLPQRYAIRCVDELGLILRAEIVWSKPNGLPESVTDRVRRSHEVWWHFTLSPRYFSAVDEIREPHTGEFLSSGVRNPRHGRPGGLMPGAAAGIHPGKKQSAGETDGRAWSSADNGNNPLGKLPGSVWTVPTEPLRVPDHLGVDHFAAFPTEWPKRIIAGWSPAGVCVACGEGRRPVRDGAWHFTQPSHDVDRAALASVQRAGVTPDVVAERYGLKTKKGDNHSDGQANVHSGVVRLASDFGISQLAARNAMSNAKRGIGAYTCACPDPTADTRPAVILDPFGGTGTTALVAKALGRHGITVDMSADYCRLAEWRTNDRDQLAKVLGIAKAEQQPSDQAGLFDLDGGAA